MLETSSDLGKVESKLFCSSCRGTDWWMHCAHQNSCVTPPTKTKLILLQGCLSTYLIPFQISVKVLLWRKFPRILSKNKQTNLLCQSKTKGQKFPPSDFLLNQLGIIERYQEIFCSSELVTDSHLPHSLCELCWVLKGLMVCSGLNQQMHLKLSPALTWFVFLHCWSGVFMASGSLATAFIGSIKAFSS